MGASFKDLIDLLVEFGAVNAANLDGGMSSLLVYNDELVNIGSSLYGPRKIPTFFMVRPAEQEQNG
jgi:exopolysaccharide biosynthesis protein